MESSTPRSLGPETRIYLNQAGTTWPKPRSVREAVRRTLIAAPDEAVEVLETAHREVCRYLGIENPERFLFTGGCTAALAIALADLPWEADDVVLTSRLEHHALVRPVLELVRQVGVRHVAAPYAPGTPVDLAFVESVLREGRVRLVACSMASNVTGELLPVDELASLSRRHGARLLIDAAQTCGVVPIDVRTLGADILTFAGHKGPHGPTGVGGLWIREGVPLECPTAACSLGPAGAPPATFPGYCDTGGVNLPSVAGLAAGLRWLEELPDGAGYERAIRLTGRLRDSLRSAQGIRLHGNGDPSGGTAVLSLTFRDHTPAEIESRLRSLGITARAGHHCAPLAHEAIGTAETGSLRLSLGPQQTEAEIDEVASHLLGWAGATA